MPKMVWVVDEILNKKNGSGFFLVETGKKIGVEFEFFETPRIAILRLRSFCPDLILVSSAFFCGYSQGDEIIAEIKRLSDIPVIKMVFFSEVDDKDGQIILRMHLTKDFADEDGLIRKFLFGKK